MNLMRAAVLANYAEVARELGLRPDDQLRRVGLSLQAIALVDRLVPSDAVALLLENTAAASGCQAVGLRMAEHRRMSHFGAVGLLLAQQPTLRDVLRAVMAYQPLLNESVALHVEEVDGVVVLHVEVMTRVPMPTRQVVELAMGSAVHLFRTIVGAGWTPQRAIFRHPAPDALDAHRRMFRCRCEFDQEFNGLSFAAVDLDIRNPAAEPAMARYAEDFVQTLPGTAGSAVGARVRQLICLLLPLGTATIEQVAQSIGCSVRKLQRELETTGESFVTLLDEARADRARLYLDHTQLRLGQVAALLGYNHQSSFTRWFVGRFGVTPTEYRARGAPEASAG